MDHIEKLQISPDQYEAIKNAGMEQYQSVRKNGFRRTYEARYNTPVNYDLPEIMFDFTYFISTTVNYDIIIFMNSLSEIRSTDEKVNEACNAFSIILDQILDKLKMIIEIAATSITLKSPNTKEEWADLLAAQRDCINGTMDVSGIISNFLSILVGNDIDYIDGMDEILEDLQQLYLAMEKIVEIGTENN